MNSFYDLPEDEQVRLRKAGVSNDLIQCLNYHPQNEFYFLDIEEVLAYWNGHRDNKWRWIIRLRKRDYAKKFVYVFAEMNRAGWEYPSTILCRYGNRTLDAMAYEGNQKVYNVLFRQLSTNGKPNKEISI